MTAHVRNHNDFHIDAAMDVIIPRRARPTMPRNPRRLADTGPNAGHVTDRIDPAKYLMAFAS